MMCGVAALAERKGFSATFAENTNKTKDYRCARYPPGTGVPNYCSNPLMRAAQHEPSRNKIHRAAGQPVSIEAPNTH